MNMMKLRNCIAVMMRMTKEQRDYVLDYAIENWPDCEVDAVKMVMQSCELNEQVNARR